jgi:ribose transport system substrate-binding protein
VFNTSTVGTNYGTLYRVIDLTTHSGLTDDAGSRVPAVTRAARVLYEVATHGPGTLSDLFRRAGVPKSSMLGICQVLADERLLMLEPDGRYRLGLAVAELAEAWRRQPPQLTSLGVTVQNQENAFFAVEAESIREACAESGVHVDVRSADQDLRTQVDQIAGFVSDGCEAVIVDAVDSDGVRDAIRAAVEAGVVVVAVNVGAHGAQATVTTDNVQAGQLIGQAVARQLGGRGTVAVIDGLPVTAVRDRIIGFRAFVRDFPEITVLPNVPGDHSPAGGYRAAARLLADGVPDAVFAINDPTALGACEYFAERGRDVPVFSVDGSAPVVKVIAEGGLIRATAAQDPAELARRAFAAAAALRSGTAHVPVQQSLPTRLVDAASIGSYVPWA